MDYEFTNHIAALCATRGTDVFRLRKQESLNHLPQRTRWRLARQNSAKHVANIAAATAFTAIRWCEDERILNWSGLPLTSRLAIGLLATRKGMVKSAVQPKSLFPYT
jgi:hypothetical protein